MDADHSHEEIVESGRVCSLKVGCKDEVFEPDQGHAEGSGERRILEKKDLLYDMEDDTGQWRTPER